MIVDDLFAKETIGKLSIWNSFRTFPGYRGSGITARRTKPGNRAHTFRMTFVAQGKLPQMICYVMLCYDMLMLCYVMLCYIMLCNII